MTPIDYAIVLAFLLSMALAGLAISRLIKTSDDLFVAGRELTPFILCATITATNLSMFHFVGLGGIAATSGVSIVWQNWTGSIALVISATFVVPVFRRLGIRSVPEFLQLRYSKGLRTLAGAFWAVRLCVYLGILLYIAATAAIVITGCANTTANYTRWLLAFSIVSIIYSAVGGAWAVAIMDSVQFCVMLAGALLILPIAAKAAGGMPAVLHHFNALPGDAHAQLVPASGEFGWLFIAAITLLSVKWATIDQAILQRAFGARSPRDAAKGMVLSAIITTPIALFWILPGLAAKKLHPAAFPNPDDAIPWLLATTIPPIGRGFLGFVLCGLVAAQISAVTADVNSVATLFSSDVYRALLKRPPSQKHLIRVIRASSVACGVLMLYAAYLLRQYGAGAARANLAVVGILDMPLFVITVIYGLAWPRANWQGAVAAFLAGGLLGFFAYFLILPDYFNSYLAPLLPHLPNILSTALQSTHAQLAPHRQSIRNFVPFISSVTALVVCPIVSLLTRKPAQETTRIRQAFTATPTDQNNDDTFHLKPTTPPGKLGVTLVILGTATFFLSICSAPLGNPCAAPLAVAGMLITFAGGLLRAYSH